jgi:hypothetical protein
MGDKSDTRPEDRPDRQEVPGVRREADRKPDREHDDHHRQIGAEVNSDPETGGASPRGPALRIVATKLRERQVGKKPA